jgi:hypothetical protein
MARIAQWSTHVPAFRAPSLERPLTPSLSLAFSLRVESDAAARYLASRERCIRMGRGRPRSEMLLRRLTFGEGDRFPLFDEFLRCHTIVRCRVVPVMAVHGRRASMCKSDIGYRKIGEAATASGSAETLTRSPRSLNLRSIDQLLPIKQFIEIIVAGIHARRFDTFDFFVGQFPRQETAALG